MAGKTVARILKVNQGGEYGAIRIYAAQILTARLRCPDLTPELSELLSHEREHERRFRGLMPARAARPCRLMWLWGAGGMALGFMTGLTGRTGVLVCTEAVERTVHVHLEEQRAWLNGRDPELETAIADIQAQEQGHIDWAAGPARPDNIATRLLYGFVVWTVEAIIWLGTQGDSMRLQREVKSLMLKREKVAP